MGTRGKLDMMQLSIWILFCAGLVWLVVFLLHSIRLESSSLSAFELKRRSDEGDGDAQKATEREQALPRLMTLRRLTETILLVVAIVLTVLALGWFVGTLVASALVLGLGRVSRIAFVSSSATRLYGSYESRLMALAATWSWLDWFSDAVGPERDTSAASKEELQHIIERSAGVLSRDVFQRLQASITLDNHTVQDVMTPASVVETADIKDTLGPLVLDGLHKTGHSRFPVANGDIHHIEGILYLHDIINLKSAKKSVREAMDPRVHYIHEEQSLEHALHGFLRTHRHLFVVVNDYRETVGVVTLEDVLEALLGKKIVDEFDQFDDLRVVAASNPRKNNLPKGKTDI